MTKPKAAKVGKLPAKLPKALKGPPKKAKTKASAPGGDAVADMVGHNKKSKLTPDQERKLFLEHRGAWNRAQAKVKAAQAVLTDVKAALKNDGFTVKQFQIADALADVKGEVRIHTEVTDRLKVARWIGHPMGSQMDLFEQPDRTPSVDRAYDQGKQASMENKPAKPPYAPDLPQYKSYMDGFHDHQRQLAGGIKALGPREPGERTVIGVAKTTPIRERLDEMQQSGDKPN